MMRLALIKQINFVQKRGCLTFFLSLSCSWYFGLSAAKEENYFVRNLTRLTSPNYRKIAASESMRNFLLFLSFSLFSYLFSFAFAHLLAHSRYLTNDTLHQNLFLSRVICFYPAHCVSCFIYIYMHCGIVATHRFHMNKYCVCLCILGMKLKWRKIEEERQTQRENEKRDWKRVTDFFHITYKWIIFGVQK